MRQVPWRTVVLVASMVLTALPATCLAQEEVSDADTERARALFAEALELADAGDWERAVHRFRRALELRDAPAIRFNLASSLVRLGRLRQALGELDQIDASAESTPELRAQADALRSEIAPRLAQLRVDVSDPNGDTHVTVDGEPWEALGRFAPSNPGVLEVRLWRGDDELDHEEVDVPDGGRATVALVAPTPIPVDVSPQAAAEAAATQTDEDGSDDGLWIGLGVGAGVAVVAAAVILVVVLAAEPSQTSEGDFDPGVLRVQ